MVDLDKIESDLIWIISCLEEHKKLNNYTEGDFEYFRGMVKAYKNMLDFN